MNRFGRVVALWMALCLGACGGGGGGNNSSDNSWLTFSPNPVEASLMEGTSSPLTVTAHSSRTVSQALFARIVDTDGVTTGTIDLYNTTPYDYVATMQVSPSLSPGVYAGNFEVSLYTDPDFTHLYEGSPWKVPYQITVGARHAVHKILVDRQAVGLAAFPTAARSRLTAEVSVLDNQGKTTHWNASSDQPWLTVTATGATGAGGSTLTLTAAPGSLPADAIGYANVTVSSSDPTVANTETIRVAIWKGSSDPATHSGGTLYKKTLADPAAPLVYAHNGGVIDILNAYTGARVGTLDPGTGVSLEEMTTSGDGTRLFAISATQQKLVVFDLVNRSKLAAWPFPNNVYGDRGIAYLRPNGVGVLATTGTTMFSATTGEVLRSDLELLAYRFVVNGLGDTLYGVDNGASPPTLTKWSLDFVDYPGFGLLVDRVKAQTDFDSAGYGPRIALSPDGRKVYAGAAIVDSATFELLAQLPWGEADNSMASLAVGSDGRVYANYGTVLDVFDPLGNIEHRMVSSTVIGGATVTADGILCAFAEYDYSGGNGYPVAGPLRFEPFAP